MIWNDRSKQNTVVATDVIRRQKLITNANIFSSKLHKVEHSVENGKTKIMSVLMSR